MTDTGPALRGRPEAPSGPALPFSLSRRQARLLDVLLVLGVLALGIVVVEALARVFFDFGDVILVFFLAWLIAFILSPLVRRMIRLVPGLPRVVAVAVVYVVLIGGTVALTVFAAQALASSISHFVASVPQLLRDLPTMVRPFQSWLQALGFGQVDLVMAAQQVLTSLRDSATGLVGPLQSIAVASLGVIGTMLIVIILSIYIVIDQDGIRRFLNRLVPPGRRDAAALFEASVSRSFGGFLRGQAVIGLSYAFVALLASATFGLDFLAITTALSGVLMAIPFFGPFVAWAPPVIVAIVTQPGAIVPALVIMAVGWFLVMNVLQPRLMSGAIGLHPIVVLGSVIVGSKVAGVAGAIFGIPVAAVLASIFFHYLEIFGGGPSIAERAVRRVEAREGRRFRVPREPSPGIDEDVRDDAPAPPTER